MGNRRRLKKQKGFTLIEAVVAAGIFAFVVASSLGVYIAVIQLDTKSRGERTVQQNARFITDFFSKEIRNGSINYGAQQTSQILSIINQQDQQESISFSNGDLILNKVGFGQTRLNSDKVEVSNFQVILSPLANPFDSANNSNIQPHVTVVMTLKSKEPRASVSSTMNLESTYSVRDYPSRE